MPFQIEVLHDGQWSDDASLLGYGCTRKANVWRSREMALGAIHDLVVSAGFERHRLRVRETTNQTMTPEEMLDDTAIGCGLHRWGVDGGSIEVATAELAPVLREAYACHGKYMEDWWTMIERVEADQDDEDSVGYWRVA